MPTYQQILQACPGIRPDVDGKHALFVVAQTEAGASLAEIRDRWNSRPYTAKLKGGPCDGQTMELNRRYGRPRWSINRPLSHLGRENLHMYQQLGRDDGADVVEYQHVAVYAMPSHAKAA